MNEITESEKCPTCGGFGFIELSGGMGALCPDCRENDDED